jgi:DNA ligase-1
MSASLDTIARSWRAIAEAAGRNDKVDRLAACLQAVPPSDLPIVVAWLSGELRQGRIGVGATAIREAFRQPPADVASLPARDVDAAFDRIADTRGRGSAGRRQALLDDLFARATADEQAFLGRLIFGELRQGALDGLMAEAVARAAGVAPGAVRRSLMLAGDAGAVARAALEWGLDGLAGFGLRVLRPIKPMLAQPAESVAEAISRFGMTVFETKLDGARIQVHKKEDRILVFTRNLNDVTASVPEAVEAVRAMPARELVLDGETIALRPDGGPLPFQATMKRFGRKVDVERARTTVPLSCFFFDCLHADGETLLDRPARERLRSLDRVVPPQHRVERRLTADAGEAGAFLRAVLDAGHEGLMAKDPESTYDAGARGGSWLKVKPAHTLDLVVLAAEWGSGRRRGWLSNLHLGARDPVSGGFVMLGKTFKGLTDETLEWQTRELLARERTREGRIVHVRPELVVEIAFNDVQASPRYPGGLALRFARVKRYRADKRPDDADTMEAVRAHWRRRTGDSGSVGSTA